MPPCTTMWPSCAIGASAGPASGRRSACRSRPHGSGSPERTDRRYHRAGAQWATVLPAVGISVSHLCSGVFEIHGDGERRRRAQAALDGDGPRVRLAELAGQHRGTRWARPLADLAWHAEAVRALVIGAGMAGLTLAARLCQPGRAPVIVDWWPRGLARVA